MAKITIFHGDNLVEAREALTNKTKEAKRKGLEVVVLNGTKADLTQIRSNLGANSLFGQNKLVVLENFLSLPDSSFKRKALEYLQKGQFENELILWEGKKLTNVSLQVPVKEFRLDPALFRFLDSLKEGEGEKSLISLQRLKRREKEEVIFYMIIRQIRLLILAKDLKEAGLARMAFWQKRKLVSQASLFSLRKLLAIYKKLLEIDWAQKTSQDSFSLSCRLDLLVADI